MAASMCGLMDREAAKRLALYAVEIPPSAELLRVLAMYPMFRLTHAKRARHCGWCDYRIKPFELHFVKDGMYVCQSGCMDRAPKRRGKK
jgi:hypothetical protein